MSVKMKNKLAEIMQRLYKMGLTTTLGGNISVLTEENIALITPSGTDKSKITPDDIGELTLDGEIITENFNPSIEAEMHLAVYLTCPDIKAVIHAHPPFLSALSASSLNVKNNFTVETYAILGKIAYADYALIGTRDLAAICAEAAEISNCILMRKHGALTLGRNLLEAFDRMEVFENAARLTYLFSDNFSASLSPLSKSEMNEIDRMLKKKVKNAQA